MQLRFIVIFALAFLTGCSSGFSYLAENYSATAMPEIISTSADNWWIFDKPDQGKILVQRNPGSAAAQGFFGGLMLNPTVSAAPKPYYQEAAQAYLARTGRTCTIKDGFLVVEPSWEFSYECAGASIATSGLQAEHKVTDERPTITATVSQPARPNSTFVAFKPTEIPVRSDSKARYWALELAKNRQGNAVITTRREGPSGTSYSKRECDCEGLMFRYLGDGATMADAQTPKRPPEQMTKLVFENRDFGSVSYHVCDAACSRLSR